MVLSDFCDVVVFNGQQFYKFEDVYFWFDQSVDLTDECLLSKMHDSVVHFIKRPVVVSSCNDNLFYSFDKVDGWDSQFDAGCLCVRYNKAQVDAHDKVFLDYVEYCKKIRKSYIIAYFWNQELQSYFSQEEYVEGLCDV